MSPFMGEFIGSALLVTLGDGVVANVVLNKTKGHNSGWIVITLGWAFAVFVGVFSSAAASGAHLNPAFTLAMVLLGKFSWSLVPVYFLAQLLGAMAGALVVWLVYQQHFNETPDPATQLAVFCTGPAIAHTAHNLLSEIAGTFVLVFAVLKIAAPANSLGALDALPVALVVLAVGLGLGGTTGYAINPSRDLGPRIVHALIPLPAKQGSNWQYAWIPVIGPLVGGILAAMLFKVLG
ncbi:MAG: aquaporin family protein [Bacteroidota bacterium]|nr:aquaporin family protein [Bacteroidota bacterium]